MTNIYNLFKFLEDKKGKKIPLKFKLIHAPETLTKEDLNVEGDLNLKNTKISSLPDNLKVEGSLNLENTQISSLPDNLKVWGYLSLENTPISSLPDNLTVGGFLDLRYTQITSLPDNLKVGGYLFLKNTPLADKYSKEQIRKMIEEKGGKVKGRIYITY